MPRFVTEQDVLEAAGRGEQVLTLEPGARVTDLARETAQRLGVRLVHADEVAVASQPRQASDLHDHIRTAVIARLGMEPEGLDAIIAGVLQALGGEG